MNAIFDKSAGFLSGGLLKLPNRRFMPDELIQIACSGDNLSVMGCKQNKINAGSISFDYNQSLLGALGELVERYSSGLYDSNFIFDNYENLSKNTNVIHPENFKYYSDKQYIKLESKNIYPLKSQDKIEWVKAFDYINNKYIMIPAFSVYMPYESKHKSSKSFIFTATSPGLAAGKTLKDAVISGFFECAERNAFCNFWYKQNQIVVPQYTSETILKYYGQNNYIKKLFDNKFVRMKVFDLSYISNVEVTVTFLYFEYKGLIYQSLGSAARFTKEESIYKSALEAYQGIEYAISLMDKNLLPDEVNLKEINEFDKHFHFYNKHPQYRNHCPILVDAQDYNRGDLQIFKRAEAEMCRDFTPSELRKTGLKSLPYVDITAKDVKELGYNVARVLTPKWHLLTGFHEWPYLGNFNEKDILFTKYPHPFP